MRNYHFNCSVSTLLILLGLVSAPASSWAQDRPQGDLVLRALTSAAMSEPLLVPPESPSRQTIQRIAARSNVSATGTDLACKLAEAARVATIETLTPHRVFDVWTLRGGRVTARTATEFSQRLANLSSDLADWPDDTADREVDRLIRLTELVDLTASLVEWCATPLEDWVPEEERDAAEAIAEDFVAVLLMAVRNGLPVEAARRKLLEGLDVSRRRTGEARGAAAPSAYERFD